MIQTLYEFGETLDKKDLGETEFYDIHDFKIDDDFIYIADFKGQSVSVFEKNGTLLNISGRQGRGPGEFVQGPRIIAPAHDQNKVYVIGTMPNFSVYDTELNFETYEYFIRNPVSTYGLEYFDKKLFIMTTQFSEENIIIYDFETAGLENIFLNFDLEPGLLAKYTMRKVGDYWLFAWYFKNKFKVFDEDFSLVHEYSLPHLPDKADGRVNELSMIPDEATSYRARVYSLGSFSPYGTFFKEFLALEDNHFIVQMGTLTGGPDQAIILHLDGNILQQVQLPAPGKLLGYQDGELYMLSSDGSNIVAYEFRKGYR
ncbi:MAG: 6-bladed beta-propeller [Balneolaceae bacterium]